MKRIWFIVLFLLFMESCHPINKKAYAISDNEIKLLSGAWTQSISHGYQKRKYSWGVGDYLPNVTFIIDYDVQNSSRLVIHRPGEPNPYIIDKISKDGDYFILKIIRADIPENKLVPKYGEERIIFSDVNSINIGPSTFGVFGYREESINLRRLSGPNVSEP
jgi:hypothetical protein